MARKKTEIGDIFVATLDGRTKKYFQYVASDLSQLNSDVIRAFKRGYHLEEAPELTALVKDDVQFYAHCVIKWGLEMGLWEKVGNIPDVSNEEITFRDTNEYGRSLGEEPVMISDKWYVWKINQEYRNVGKLDSETRKAYVGLVINPRGIIELLKGNKYPPNYPD